MEDMFARGEVLPVIGRTKAVGSSSWEMAAVYYPEFFADSLHDLGLSEDDVAHAITIRDDVAKAVRTIDEAEQERLSGVSYLDGGEHVRREAAAERRSALCRLLDWFKRREIREEESTETNVKVPLWTFSAPAVDGCSASVEHGEKSGTALSFDVLLLGSGLGGSAEYHTSTMWTFHASSGQTKVIFVSASVRVSRVVVLEHGRQISAGFCVDATTSKVSEPATLLLPPEVKLPVIDVAKTYPLAGDTSGDIAEYKYKYEKEIRASFGIDISALQIGAKVKTSVQINGSLALTYRLRGGYDYELRYLTEGHGLVWSLPALPS